MDPFSLCLALGPLSLYLLVLGAINLRSRPLVISGARDTAALALAVSGMMIVGPLELFLPDAAAERFGGYVWVLWTTLYGLGIVLLILVQRPRLVIYNATLNDLKPMLESTLSGLDEHCNIAGRSCYLPTLGVEFHVDSYPLMRNVSLLAVDSQQSLVGWSRLEQRMTETIQDVKVQPNPRGVSLVVFGTALMLAVAWQLVSHPAMVAQAFREMIGL